MIDKIVTAAEHVFGVTKEQLVRTEIKRGRATRSVGDAMAAVAYAAKINGIKNKDVAKTFGRTPTGIILAVKRCKDLMDICPVYGINVEVMCNLIKETEDA